MDSAALPPVGAAVDSVLRSIRSGSMSLALEARDITKLYGHVSALSGANFEVKAGPQRCCNHAAMFYEERASSCHRCQDLNPKRYMLPNGPNSTRKKNPKQES